MYRVPAFLVFQPFHLANRVLHVGLPLFQLHMLMGKLAFVKHSTMDSRRRILHGRSTHLLIMLMLIASIVGVSSTSDTLLSTQSVRDGQTLVSRSQTFELGFFSPDNSGNRYVGIWYKNIADQTVVWVANRQSPVIDRTGVLTFDSGSLLIIDGRGSSFQVASGFAAASVAATIQDTGNLVLKDVNDSSPVLWQSFDYPTDTFLPGMKLGRAGKRNRLLTSWTTADDPSPGDYSLGIDPNGTSQFFIWQNDHIYWSSGAWNGIRFSGVPEMTSNYIFNFTFTSTMNDEYFTYFLKDDSIISRLVVDVSGQIQQLTWLDRAQKWVLFWAQPKPQCDVYNLCGDFGVCNEDNLQHCQCLTGFEPGSQADWNNGATNGGCTRKADLQCVTRGKQDGFLPLDHMKFPVSPQILDDSNDGECQSACLGNCSCTAYAFNGTCQLWFGNLKNLQQLNDNVKDKAGTLYLRLAASEFRGNKRHLQIIVSVTVITGMLLMILLVCTCWMIRRRGKKNENPELPLLALGTHLARKLGEDESAGEFAIFSFSQVACATDNFSMENKLGEGGFGPVYKGRLPEGQEIAVKRLSTRSGQGLKEFKNEILLIAKLQHRNLVRLLGFCIQGEEKILIYEYMPNKSLDFFLFDPTKRAQLEWGMCFHIIEGIAQGLLYLHKHSRMRIIHRDLKASNILLDGEMNPKISDFGMARIFSSNEIQANTNRIVGTYGYMSPEYASEGLFSIKSDVFSFGVLLLEILTGKRNAGFHQYGNSLNLLGYAWELWNKGMWLELMDPSLGGACPGADLSNCLHVALLCVQESAVDRPTMSDVITMLSSEGANLPEPKHPAFFTLRRGTEAELSSNTPKNCSVNDVTVTDIEGR